MRRYFYGVMVLVGLAFLAGAIPLRDRQEAPPDDWKRLIAEKGAETAYQIFKDRNATLPFGEQHTAAHEFGQALYQTVGIDGVTVCDSSFGFGCYHQFFLGAIADHGLSIVRDLDGTCIRKFGFGGQGCQHGVGHGIADFLNHSITEALEICGTMHWDKPLFGCQSGVFMEHNFPTLLGENESQQGTRNFDPAEPFAPCLSIPERFRVACMFAQAEWWDKSTVMSYTEAAGLCRRLDEPALANICLTGLGTSAVSANDFEAQKVLAACREIDDPDSQFLCRVGAYWGWLDAGFKDVAKLMCEDLDLQNRTRCEKEGNLAENL